MSKRTLALIIFLIIVTLLLFKLATSQNTKQEEQKVTTQSPTPTPFKFTDLYLSPSSLTVSSISGTLNADISTEENNITGIQLEMSYDPKVISVTTIKPGDFFENPSVLINKIDQKNGRISYALILPSSSAVKKGQGTAAVINFRVVNRKAGETTISFLPKTVVTAEGIAPSVLRESTGSTITIK